MGVCASRTSSVPLDVSEKLHQADQEQLTKFSSALSQKELDSLVSQIRGLDLKELNDLFYKVYGPGKKELAASSSAPASLQPLPSVTRLADSSRDQQTRWRNVGLDLIAKNKVGVLLLSGGQGTRLGADYPKGMFDIGLPSHKSLFQLQAERIRKIEQLAAARAHKSQSDVEVPWYVMTSEINHTQTVDFFRAHSFFGLKQSQVFFFQQGTLPCFDIRGKIMLETRSQVSRAPNGNGGVFSSLLNSGALEDMERRGLVGVHLFGVDNAIVKVADPVFVGFCVEQQADTGSKVVAKRSADEKVGVLCLRNGQIEVVEYSEMDPALCAQTDEQGRLAYNAGSICNHYFSVPFLRDLVAKHKDDLERKYHVAEKKIPFVNDNGQPETPDKINGIKLELFVFDSFAFARNMAVLEVDREEEFAPVKNASGPDSPESARTMVSKLHQKWIVQAGGRIVNAVNNQNLLCEVSPLLSYEGEGLASYVEGKHLALPLQLKETHRKK
eukprot:GILI01016548.1.p1 GENE.GILI01016548.1~~GILI01016548.1.p1  ORF type:complete len:525 (+),score=178.96 GILI01016548.1:83-1576(+)